MENSTGYILVLISMVTLGITNIFYKKSNNLIGGANTTFYYYLFAFIISLIVWFFIKNKEQVNLANLKYPLLIAIFLFTSVLCFNLSLKYLPVGIASTIRSLGFIITIILSVFIFKEKLDIKSIIGIIFAIISILLLK